MCLDRLCIELLLALNAKDFCIAILKVNNTSWEIFANLSVGTSPHASLRKICSETIRQLALDAGDTVYLIVRIGDDGRCIVCQEGSSGVRIVTIDVGTQRPLGVGAGGLAILSAIENIERNEIIQRNVQRYGLLAI